MTQTSRMHDNVAYTDTQFAEVFNSVHLDGVDLGLYNGLKVYQNTPAAMNVLVPTGRAWVQGRWYKNDAIVTATITAADATYARIDTIVLRLTVAGSPGNIQIAVLAGTPASSPTATALTQTAATWEIPLAFVTVGANVATIVTANITDARKNLASGSLGYVIDGGGIAVTTGSKGFMQIPFSCTIIGWTLIADQQGSAVVDVKSQLLATTAWPATTTTTTTITGSDLPTLAAQKAARSFAMTGWTQAVAEGTLLEFNVNSATTVLRLTLQLHFVRTN